MLQGLRTIIYHVADIEQAKQWYKQVFAIEPYFDESFYVGFNVGGYELGLDPDPTTYTNGHHALTYWGVADIQSAFKRFAALNISIHEAPKNVGGPIWVGSIYDPFGNVIGLIENPEFKVG
ncbi:VOC family protein (plasmid) [Pedobacter sp. BS3]|uniref:VOC family protein n=1 Tax=Pedobacter sp. BS3 TaxID=2567937 RepID=UPI0011F05839|nr:VOC family protein [Pedobacter sp. BS3]TZF86363.1 VOC family protein [Pedobacter sp. BS3]